MVDVIAGEGERIVILMMIMTKPVKAEVQDDAKR